MEIGIFYKLVLAWFGLIGLIVAFFIVASRGEEEQQRAFEEYRSGLEAYSLFIDFLRENGAYDGYVEGLKCVQRDLKTYLLEREDSAAFIMSGDVIGAAFCWMDTREGAEYWSDLQTKWEREVKRLKSN